MTNSDSIVALVLPPLPDAWTSGVLPVSDEEFQEFFLAHLPLAAVGRRESHTVFPSLFAGIRTYNKRFSADFYGVLLPRIVAWAAAAASEAAPVATSLEYSATAARAVLAHMFLLNTPTATASQSHGQDVPPCGELSLANLYRTPVVAPPLNDSPLAGGAYGPDARGRSFAATSGTLDEIDDRECDTSVERVVCLLLYFHAQIGVSEITGTPQRTITIERRKTAARGEDWWRESGTALLTADKVNFLRDQRMEASTAKNFVDFANKYLHIHMIIPSATQEEVLFSCAPELFVAIGVCAMMEEDEVLIIKNVRRFVATSGYLYTFKAEGLLQYEQETDGVFNVLAIDATMTRHFEIPQVLRDLNKAVAVFTVDTPVNSSEDDKAIVTGHWGCGAFGGEKTHKFVQQWLAASEAGVERLDYSVFGDEELVDEWIEVMREVHARQWRTGDVFRHLLVDGQKARQGGFPIFVKRTLGIGA
ncbi:hypothetical protein HDU83_009176 [Entophlyctis luteolus]|nr:hypothetical protein HDU83_009176 [Entophlyctis luteolus]KAJ3394304.1 hypothetical protein HDU84_009059 [Entophlyctis sp. JEL0112]